MGSRAARAEPMIGSIGGRRGIVTASGTLAAAATLSFGWGAAAPPASAAGGGVGACASGTNCVSTSSSKSPSNYSPLLDCAGDTVDEAFNKLRRALEQDQGATEVVVGEGGRALRAVVDLGSGRDPADAEFVFLDEPDRCLLSFKVTARTVLPDPPFCATRGCINGSRVRRWVQNFTAGLGYLDVEYGDEDKVWRQIFLH